MASSFNGTVRSAVDNALLPSVTVSVAGKTTTTNANGAYSFVGAGLAPGTYPVNFSKAGYVSKAATVTLSAAIPEEPSLHVQMVPGVGGPPPEPPPAPGLGPTLPTSVGFNLTNWLSQNPALVIGLVVAVVVLAKKRAG